MIHQSSNPLHLQFQQQQQQPKHQKHQKQHQKEKQQRQQPESENPHQASSSTSIDHYQIPQASLSAPDLCSTNLPSNDHQKSQQETIKVTKLSPDDQILQTSTDHPENQNHISIPLTNGHHHHHHQHQRAHSEIPQSWIQSERRFQALLEIIETENGYLRDLKRLDDFYLSKLDSLNSLKQHDKQIIRRNIAQVIELAERFTRRISLAIGTNINSHQDILVNHHHNLFERWKNQSIRDETDLDRIIERVAKAFISESPIFTIYEEFCAKHTEAADLIRSFESTQEWTTLLNQPASPSSNQSFTTTAPPSPTPPINLTTSNHTNTPATTPTTTTTPTAAITSSSSTLLTSNHTTSLTPIILQPPPAIKLSLPDYIIKPIQRIMRYPMLLNGLLNQMDHDPSPSRNRAKERVQQALWAMKKVAEGVDEAKSLREIELKTELIASRMELHSSYRAAFVCLLGQIKLVGSLHVLYHGPNLDPSEAFKIKYYGIFLYQTHIVIVKVKRATVYEPRHWFPIRYFEFIDIPSNSSLMPHSFSLKYRQHTFEFGATCELEKKCWMKKLKELKTEIDHLRSIQIMSAQPISDDSIVSSINLTENSALSPTEGVSRHGTPIDEDQQTSNLLNTDELTPTTAASAAATQSRVSQRFSRNVNTLLGRTAEVAQAAIDLKLTEIFSEVLLCARLQDGALESAGRARTLSATGSSSATKRHSQSTLGRGGDRKLKRMSYMEPNTCSRDMVPPLPRLFNSSPETTTLNSNNSDGSSSNSSSGNSSSSSNQSNSSSLRRARSGPTIVTRVSSSSLHAAEHHKSTLSVQPDPQPRSRNYSHSTPLIEIGPSQEEISPRCSSPEIEDVTNTAKADGDPVMMRSHPSHSGSTLWLPGLKMVRRLSRVGTKSKKDQQQQHPDRLNSDHKDHSTQQDHSKTNHHQNEKLKNVRRRMDRQMSAPDPIRRPGHNLSSPSAHHQSTFKRVFMKRYRSSGSHVVGEKENHDKDLTDDFGTTSSQKISPAHPDHPHAYHTNHSRQASNNSSGFGSMFRSMMRLTPLTDPSAPTTTASSTPTTVSSTD